MDHRNSQNKTAERIIGYLFLKTYTYVYIYMYVYIYKHTYPVSM